MALVKYSAFANSIIASKSFRVQSSDVKQQLKIDSGASKSVQCHPYSSADGIAEVFFRDPLMSRVCFKIQSVPRHSRCIKGIPPSLTFPPVDREILWQWCSQIELSVKLCLLKFFPIKLEFSSSPRFRREMSFNLSLGKEKWLCHFAYTMCEHINHCKASDKICI